MTKYELVLAKLGGGTEKATVRASAWREEGNFLIFHEVADGARFVAAYPVNRIYEVKRAEDQS